MVQRALYVDFRHLPRRARAEFKKSTHARDGPVCLLVYVRYTTRLRKDPRAIRKRQPEGEARHAYIHASLKSHTPHRSPRGAPGRHTLTPHTKPGRAIADAKGRQQRAPLSTMAYDSLRRGARARWALRVATRDGPREGGHSDRAPSPRLARGPGTDRTARARCVWCVCAKKHQLVEPIR